VNFIEKLLIGRELSKEARDYFLTEYHKHTIVIAVPVVLASIVLALFEYKAHQNNLVWMWLVCMTAIQVVRLFIDRFKLSHASIYQTIFFVVEYGTSVWLVVFLFLFGWQSSNESEIVFNGFFVYSMIVYHLEILRYNMTRLVGHAFIVCAGIIIYLTLFTQLGADLKLAYGLLIGFGFFMLIHFGRSSHKMALDAYDLLSQNHKLIAKMDDMLLIDELTQQNNRRYFNAQLSKHAELYKVNQEHFSLAMMDIDNFKDINDTYGHDVGDQAVISVAQFIKESIRETDVFARYGGDEFVLIFPVNNLQVATTVLEKIRKRFVDHCFVFAGREIDITISIGVTKINQSDTEETILKRADTALYQAKEGGRNQVVALV